MKLNNKLYSKYIIKKVNQLFFSFFALIAFAGCIGYSSCNDLDAACNPLLASLLYKARISDRVLAFTNSNKYYESTDQGKWVISRYRGTLTTFKDISRIGIEMFAVDNVTNGTVWKSTNRGENWIGLNTGAGFAHSAIATCDSGRLIVIHDTGAQLEATYSDDKGKNWTSASATANPASNTVHNIVCKGGRAYLSFNAAPYVRYSTNEGDNWASPAGAPAAQPLGVDATPDGQTVIGFSITASITERFSTDGGVNYPLGDGSNIGTFNGAFLYHNKFIMSYFSVPNCIFSSSTTGGSLTYSNVSTFCTTGTTLIPGIGNDQHIYFGGTNGSAGPTVVASHDSGLSWTQEAVPAASGVTTINELIYLPGQ